MTTVPCNQPAAWTFHEYGQGVPDCHVCARHVSAIVAMLDYHCASYEQRTPPPGATCRWPTATFDPVNPPGLPRLTSKLDAPHPVAHRACARCAEAAAVLEEALDDAGEEPPSVAALRRALEILKGPHK